ncbi:MAG: cyclic nucleotide-binding/CBS domain-containing protein [Oscillochloridaceae bacterium umkhey_bin13]
MIANMDRLIGDEQRSHPAIGPDLVKPVAISSYPRLSVGALMTRNVISVGSQAPLSDTTHLMRSRGITSVVVEPNGDGVWGIMTMRDVLKRLAREDRPLEGATVAEIATRPLITITPEASLRECANLMLEKNIRRVVVVQGSEPIGIISETDIFRFVEEHA